jgi:hypothetical protein
VIVNKMSALMSNKNAGESYFVWGLKKDSDVRLDPDCIGMEWEMIGAAHPYMPVNRYFGDGN